MAGTTAKKTTAAKKTTTAKKTTSAKNTTDTLKLTAAETKMVQLYRKADKDTKAAIVKILEGKAEMQDLLGLLIAAKLGGGSASEKKPGLADLLGKDGGLSDLLGKDGGLGDLLGKDGGLGDLLGKDGGLGDLLGKKDTLSDIMTLLKK